jgi:hypothetical protein
VAITDALCGSFLDLWWHFDPAAATLAGIAGNDGRLGGFDGESLRQHVAALRSIAGAVEDLDVVEITDEIDRTALLDHLRVLLFRFEHEQPYRRSPALWVEHLCQALDGLLGRAPDSAVAEAVLSRLGEIPRFLADARGSLRSPPPLLVDIALAQLDGLTELIEAARGIHAPGGDALATVAEAEAAVEQFRLALGSEIAPNPDPGAVAIGEEEVDRRLHYEHASVHNGAEVWRGALRLAAEVEADVTALAAAIDPSRSWREVYQRAQPSRRPLEDLMERYRTALTEARRFAELHGLADPTGAALAARPAPAYALVLEPEVSYLPAGAGPATLLVGGREPRGLPWLAARLGVPGIHLHRARCDALPGLVRRHIAAPSTPAGWALYAGQVMRDSGYASQPELRLAERVLFLHDAHLAVVDVGLHTRQLSPGDAIDHLLEHLATDRGSAEADLRRVAVRPLSACAAILGLQELQRLREDVRARDGTAFDARGFHEELFAYGGLPVPLIRWGMGLDG